MGVEGAFDCLKLSQKSLNIPNVRRARFDPTEPLSAR